MQIELLTGDGTKLRIIKEHTGSEEPDILYNQIEQLYDELIMMGCDCEIVYISKEKFVKDSIVLTIGLKR